MGVMTLNYVIMLSRAHTCRHVKYHMYIMKESQSSTSMNIETVMLTMGVTSFQSIVCPL